MFMSSRPTAFMWSKRNWVARPLSVAASGLQRMCRSMDQAFTDAIEHRRKMQLNHGYPPADVPGIGSVGFVIGCLLLGASAVLVAALIAAALISPSEWVEAWLSVEAALS